MVENSESKLKPESLSLNRNLLDYAWGIYTIYDRSAVKFQKRVTFLRLLILRLSVVVTVLAVLNSQIDIYIRNLNLGNTLIVLYARDILDASVIIAPIVLSTLLAGAIKFDRGVQWVLLRGSAETIKQEIYRYRTKVKNYKDPRIRDANFAQEIQTINERLMKTQVNQGGLSWDELPTIREQRPLQEPYKVQDEEQKFLEDTKEAQGEDIYGALTAEEYIEFRLVNQLEWYQGKALQLDKKWQWWQWWIYILGGLGTYLATTHFEVWIAVTNSMAASVVSFLEFRQFDQTLIGYNQTVTNLENILFWWHALTAESRANSTNFENLVETCETVINKETTSWVQDMRNSLSTLYEQDKAATQIKKETEK